MLTLGSELQRRTHVISRELREIRHDLLRGHPTSEILERVMNIFPDRCFAFDEFGPLCH